MRNMKRILSFLLVLSMVLSYVPMPTLAAEGDTCTVTEGCEGTYNAEGICTVCNLAQLVVTEGAEECQHSGGTATCTALAVCEKCNETYGELAAHTGGEATCKAQAVCTVCTAAYGELAAHSYENGVCAGCGDVCAHAEYAEGKCIVCGNAEPDEPEECQHSGGIATCKEQAICEKCETAYGELAAHNYGTDADGKCDACGADCSHAEYLDGKCKVCGMDEPVQEPVVLTITAWNWVDDYEIIDPEYMDAVIPGVGTENPIDWETLVELLPAYITAVVDGQEVEIPVTWECETFPETATGGQYTLKAILPEDYALSEEVTSLELKVDLGTVEQLDATIWDGTKASQAWESGSGTEADPYIIMTAAQLAKLASNVNNGTEYTDTYFKLGANLDLNGREKSWTTIGNSSSKYFDGHFDGSSKTISNISKLTSGQYALFGYIGTNGVLTDLNVSNVAITTGSYAAGIVYYNKGTIENCTISNSTITTTSYAAGLVVTNYKTGTVTGCTASNVSISSVYIAAGLVAQNEGTIANCKVTSGTVTGSNPGNDSWVGGICGTSTGGAISGCSNAATVSAEAGRYCAAAGIVAGPNKNSSNQSVQVTGCVNTGRITSSIYAGGIAGYYQTSVYVNIALSYNEGPINGSKAGGIAALRSNNSSDNILNCYNTGTVTSTSYAGGIASNGGNGKIQNCHNYAKVISDSVAGYIVASKSGTWPGEGKLINNHAIDGNAQAPYICKYLDTSISYADAVTVGSTVAEFKDGTVLDKLNAGNTETVWYQDVNYPVLEKKEVAHQHDWTYAADDAADTITATCANTDGKCTVNPAELKMTAPTDLAYDGSPKEPVIAQIPANSFTGYQISYTGATTDGKPVNVGEYTAKLTLADKEISISYTITKAAPVVSKEPSGKTQEFNGSAQTLVNAGNVTGGTFQYKLGENGTWSAEIPTATNVGSYTVYWKVTGDSNHSDLDEGKSVAATISECSMTGISAQDITVTYDGNEHPITVTGVSTGATITYSADGTTYTENQPIKKNVADSGTVYYKVVAPNYQDYTGSATVTIQPKSVTVSGIAAKGKTYDGATSAELDYNNVQLVGKLTDDTLTVTAAGVFSDKNAGENKNVNITGLTLGGDSVGNYTLATTGQQTTATATIAPMGITVNIVPNGGTFGSEITAATVDVIETTPDTVGVTLTYTGTANDGTNVNGTSVPIKAGTYTVTATVSDTNYDLTGTNTAEFVVAKATVEAPSIAGKEYNGATQTADITATAQYDVTKNDGGLAIGEYEVVLTLKDSANYKWTDSEESTKTLTFKITSGVLKDSNVTIEADLTYHGESQEPTITVKDGSIELTSADYAVSYEKVNENASATPIVGAPVDAGTYNVVITGKGSYGGEVRKSFVIKPNTSIDVEPTTLENVTYTGAEIKPAVMVKGVKLTTLEVGMDYTITYENNTNAGTAKVTITGIGNYAGAKKELTFTINPKELKQENVSLSDTVLGYDGNTQKPTVTVKDGNKVLDEGEAKDYLVTITYNGYQTAESKEMGIYTLTVTGKGNYTGTVSQKYVITDDVTAPVIEGVTNGKTYYTTQKVVAKDTNLVSVAKNGTLVNPVVPTGTEVELEGNCTATYTVTAVDIAELNASVTITMKPISTLDDTIENLTVENVKLTDNNAIQAVLDKVTPIRNNECNHAAQSEKDALGTIIKNCNDLLKVITDAEDAIAKITAMPDPSKTEPDDEDAVKAYEAAKAAYDALSAHGKELVGEENKAKLDAMLKALTAYDVIEGHKSSYTKGSSKTFAITANGYFGKFTSLKVDGKVLDAKYYTAKSGSTIVTLKNSYLDSLSDGKHTVEFLYTDGSTGGDHYFRISTNNGSPFTGDSSHTIFFTGMVMTSLLGLAMMAMFVSRKKGKYRK